MDGVNLAEELVLGTMQFAAQKLGQPELAALANVIGTLRDAGLDKFLEQWFSEKIGTINGLAGKVVD